MISYIMIILSCTKQTDVNNKENNKSATSQILGAYQNETIYDGKVFLINDYMIGNKYQGPNSTFSFQGSLPLNSNFSNITFNGYPVTIINNRFSKFSSSDTVNLRGNMSTFFGASNNISIDNKVFFNEFYVPSPIDVDFTNDNDYEFSKQSGISFNMNVDENYQNPIIVVLEYIDENLQAGDIILTKFYILDSQTRSFTIPTEDLSEFPTSQNLILYVGCGNSNEVNFNNKLYDLEGINITVIPRLRLN